MTLLTMAQASRMIANARATLSGWRLMRLRIA